MTIRMTVAALALWFCTSATFAQSIAPGAPPGDLPGAPPGPQAGGPGPLPTAPSAIPRSTWIDSAPAPANATASDAAFWADGDLLLSWFRGVTMPPLVTTSPVGTPQAQAGVLGLPTTAVLFGGGSAENGMRVGFRVAAGYWFGSDRVFGIEAGYMMLGTDSTSFATSSDVFPILARPFTDATNFTPQAALVAYPGLAKDSIAAQATSSHFYSGNIDFDAKLVNEGWFRLIGLAGYRYYRYDEGLNIQQTVQPTSPIFVAGTQIAVADHFSTHNIFQGVDLGVRPEFVWQGLTADLLARAWVGNMHHTVDVLGQQIVTVPGFATVTTPGGLYALATNIGRHMSSDWVVTPEFGAGVSWQVLPTLKLRLGYGLIFLNNVARAPDQVNTVINPLRLPGQPATTTGPGEPAFNLNRTDIWIQNVNLGLEFVY
jgi:opacity protein-like surface antigen